MDVWIAMAEVRVDRASLKTFHATHNRAPLTKSLSPLSSFSILSGRGPSKNPAYTKNASRRTKNLKTVLGQERERERLEREKRRRVREEAMEVDNATSASPIVVDDIPSCEWSFV